MSDEKIIVRWGAVGTIGGIALSIYLILVGIILIVGKTPIPDWFTGILAVVAGIFILIGR